MNILLLFSPISSLYLRDNSFHLYSYFYRKGNITCILYQSPTVLTTVCTLFYFFSLSLFLWFYCSHMCSFQINIYQLSLEQSETTNELLHSSCVRLLPVFNQILCPSCSSCSSCICSKAALEIFDWWWTQELLKHSKPCRFSFMNIFKMGLC